ncbi:MAG: c-type cytochrome [Silicimonas sp.]|nr:c-type cytochrome [Silicimonas sp.]
MRFGLICFLGFFAAPLAAQDIEEGTQAFFDHCAGCHGVEAQGDGPMAALLTIAPADLTGLAARNDGTFPTARVIQRVDGTTEVTAHGDPMPVFGLLLQGPSVAIVAPDGREIVAPEAIVNIAAWLEGIQQ